MKLELKLEALQMKHLAEMEKLLQLWASLLFSLHLFSEKIASKRMKDSSKGVFRLDSNQDLYESYGKMGWLSVDLFHFPFVDV